jgi:DNA-binding NarL/FixJ family response regulator
VFFLGPVELALGRAALDLGRLDEALADLGAAVDAADRAGAAGFVAEAQYHRALAYRARGGPGDHDRAVAAVGDAARLVGALGMTPWIERVTALRERLRPARPDLSPREAEVAALVAEGLTNRQIAARLVLSERTVESHVQHVLTKLGFGSRSQVAAWVVRAGTP